MAVAKKLNYVDCWTPVTALHVHDDYLFTGSGNKLELWPIADLEKPWRSLSSKRLSNPFSIHGIQTKTTTDGGLLVIVSGNRYLTILKVINDPPSQYNIKLEYVKESIYLGDWITTVKLHHDIIFAVLSNNSFVMVDMQTWKVSEKISSPVQCIIYSALILSIDCSENVLIASGTPFKTTSIWCHRNSSVNVIATLNHHEGAVFAIEYDYSSNTLFTASDDRCINVWSHVDCLIGDAFSWSSGKFILRHQLYSHTARIFSLITLDGYLISCGENEEICIWLPYSGALVNKSDNSDGSSLWCLAVSRSQGIVYVGSNDTSVRRFSLKGKLAHSKRISWHCQQSIPKVIKYLDSSSSHPDLLCVTDNGQCSILYINKGVITTKRSVYLSESFASYCVGCLDNQNIFYCANRYGMVKAISLPSMEEIFTFQAHEGKILSCLFVGDSILLTSDVDGEIRLWNQKDLVNEYQLQSCRHRWVNCALYDNNRLIVGDASGNLSVFSSQQISPIQSFRSIHDKHGVTDLKFHPIFAKTLLSSGRDGQVIEYLWNGETLTKLRLVPIKTEFDWIEGIQFDRDNELTLIGFSSKNFVVWRKVDSSRLWSINCGGGHRLWDFKVVNDSLNFCYFSHSDLNFISRLITPMEIANPFIKPKFHSSKINCCCLIDYDEPKAIIATGGEDCNIVLSEFNSTNGHFKNTDNCKGHISAVRALASLKKSDGTILMVSAGGQSQLIIWSVTVRKGQRLIISQIYNTVVDDKTRKRLRETLEKYNDPISRYLSINIKESELPDSYLISVTCSDSLIKIFSFTENSLDPYKQIKVCNYCPLSMHRINKTLITGSNDGNLRFLVINNQIKTVNNVETLESQIEKLDLSIFNRKTCDISSHEAGVNCIDSRLIKDDIWLIVSSGDDAVLTASLVELADENVNLIVQKKVGHIHCSQISVVSIFDDVSLLTCSIDQKIAIWSYSVNSDADDITIHPILSRLISVADISSSTILYVKPDRFVIITGVGIEILKVSE